MKPRTPEAITADLTRVEEVRLEVERLTGLFKRRKACKWTLNRAERVLRALEDLKAAVVSEQGD